MITGACPLHPNIPTPNSAFGGFSLAASNTKMLSLRYTLLQYLLGIYFLNLSVRTLSGHLPIL